MKTEKEIIQDILSHKYYVHGNCIKCGKEFEKCTNSKGISSACCSDSCVKEIRAERIKRSKERHHYEVFKDDKYYYLKVDGVYDEKRTFSGRTWHIKNGIIPNNSIKIIDKVSAYLYDDKHPFVEWKNLKEATNDGLPPIESMSIRPMI